MRYHTHFELNSYTSYHNGCNDKVYTIIDYDMATGINEEITEIDSFDLPQEEIEEIDTVLRGMGESMDHGHTRAMSGMGEACLMAAPKMLAK